LINLIKKKIEDNPRRWHEVLSEGLWAHHISRHGVTKVTPFELVCGQKVVLPIEVNLDAYRFAKQNDLSTVIYHDLMMDNIDEVTNKRIKALKDMEKDKARVAWAYNKKVKNKSFEVGDLVWKTMLPIGTKSNMFGKWLPNWKGPYRVIKVIFGNSYLLETLQGDSLPRAINGRHLKKYFPSVW
jgi:dihydroneopterin aldolase